MRKLRLLLFSIVTVLFAIWLNIYELMLNTSSVFAQNMSPIIASIGCILAVVSLFINEE